MSSGSENTGAGAPESAANSVLQAAEAGLQLVETQVSEERQGAPAQPFEHLTRVLEDGSLTVPKLATRQLADVVAC